MRCGGSARSIQEYILRSWSLVKLGTTAAQKKLFFNLRKAKAKVGALEEGDLRPENVAQIAKDLNVTEDEVIDMNRRLSGVGRQPERDGGVGRRRLDPVAGLAGGRGQRPGRAPMRKRTSWTPAARCWSQAMAVLNDREKDVLMQRRLSEDPVTLEELSESYGVSRERIRQIEVRAFEKLQAKMRELAKGKGMAIPA